MGSFKFNGVDGISASFQQLANLSDDDKLKILRPSAEKLRELQSAAIRKFYKVVSGALSESLVVEEKEGPKFVISAKGKHPGTGTGKRMKKGKDGKRRPSGNYSGTNAEVLYYLEYGTPRIAATHAIEITNDEAEDEVVRLQAEAWDEHLKSLGL